MRQSLRRTIRGSSVIVAALAGAAPSATAAELTIRIENTSPSGGFSLTPFWIALHNGGFDSYSGGQPASNFPGLTELAEDGLTGPISAAFAASPAGVAGGFDASVTSITGAGNAPVFSPGESRTGVYDIGDPLVNRYFSYASMVVPTNDLFVANGNPLAHPIFDANGDFLGPIVINLFGSGVNDNGTEVNNAFGGAAFSANGGTPTDEFNPIRNFFSQPGDVGYLATFLGSNTADGGTISSTFSSSDLIGRITITPEPGSLVLLVMGALAAGRRR